MSQRDALLAGAKTCLFEKGYGATTARDIAAAAGAHLGSIGYHFGSKDALMNAAVLDATSEWGDTVEAAVRRARAADPPARLEALLDTLFAAIPGQRDLLVASVQAYAQAQFDDRLRAALSDGFGLGRRAFAALLLDVPADRVDDAAATRVGSLVYAIVTGYIVQALTDPDSLPTARDVTAALHSLTSTRPQDGAASS